MSPRRVARPISVPESRFQEQISLIASKNLNYSLTSGDEFKSAAVARAQTGRAPAAKSKPHSEIIMKPFKSVSTALKIVALAAVAAFLFAGNASAYACKQNLENASGSAKLSKSVAQASASKQWVAAVKSVHGLQWSVWSIAKSKRFKCAKAGRKWQCRAYARPCKYVVQ